MRRPAGGSVHARGAARSLAPLGVDSLGEAPAPPTTSTDATTATARSGRPTTTDRAPARPVGGARGALIAVGLPLVWLLAVLQAPPGQARGAVLVLGWVVLAVAFERGWARAGGRGIRRRRTLPARVVDLRDPTKPDPPGTTTSTRGADRDDERITT